MALIVGTLGDADIDIPVVGASFADGEKLAAPGSTAHVVVPPSEKRTIYNVIAEKAGTNKDNVVMAGAHLDSVEAGPGINDNGSGSAALLETALQMKKVKPVNTVRFAWWAAEEAGLLGSAAYVDGLSQAEKDKIALYMNYDMVGSPNGILMAYDANESSFPAPDGRHDPRGLRGDREPLRALLHLGRRAVRRRGVLRSQRLPGLHRGGHPVGRPVHRRRGRQDREQAAIWGGTAGESFDPCYHAACDTYDNVDLEWLDVNSDLIAYAALTYAYSTESVNGVKGKTVPGVEAAPGAGRAGDDGQRRGVTTACNSAIAAE